MWSVFLKTGFVGWVLLGFSIIALAIILYRLVYFILYPRIKIAFLGEAYNLVINDEMDEAKEFMATSRNSSFKHASTLLMHNQHQPKPMRDELVTHFLSEYLPEVFKGIRGLRLIGVMSPMLGLLGTVLGMIRAFKDIAGSTKPVNPAMLADGLWEAMLTTALGMLIAIPCLFFAYLYGRRAEKIEHELVYGLNMISLGIEKVDVSL